MGRALIKVTPTCFLLLAYLSGWFKSHESSKGSEAQTQNDVTMVCHHFLWVPCLFEFEASHCDFCLGVQAKSTKSNEGSKE